MGNTAIKVENLSKIYRLGEIGTGTISRDMERWFKTRILKQEDPFLKIGETNDRANKGASDIVYSLQDINFEINQGDVVGIIGRNGAGKSTLLKILSRVTTPSTGKINIKGRVASLLEVGTGFHPELTGRENIYLNGAILGMRKREIDRKLDEIIDFSGVERYIDTPVKRYSSGMYVRLAFAVAAHLESEILIVDEVLAVGDTEFQKKCLGKMGEVSKGEGRTVLFVSHNLAAVQAFCEKSILIKTGKIHLFGSTREVLDEYKNDERVFEPKQNNEVVLQNSIISHGIIKLGVLVDGEPQLNLNYGSKLELFIDYYSERDMFSAEIGFAIVDSNDRFFLGLNNKHLGNSILIKKGFGRAKIDIESFPLYMDDELFLNLYFGDIDGTYEILEKVLPLQINSGNVDFEFQKLDSKYNSIIHKTITINNEF
jgi:lipopolysaccharide transport system ATP-binding protein